MDTEFPYVKIPVELLPVIGEQIENTRVYEKEGPEEEVGPWYEAIAEVVGGCLSPGGVCAIAQVSRAAVHKRMKEGRLTAFLFTVTERRTNLFGNNKKVRQDPYVMIPDSEAKAWRIDNYRRAMDQGRISELEMENSLPEWADVFYPWLQKWHKTKDREESKKISLLRKSSGKFFNLF